MEQQRIVQPSEEDKYPQEKMKRRKKEKEEKKEREETIGKNPRLAVQ